MYVGGGELCMSQTSLNVCRMPVTRSLADSWLATKCPVLAQAGAVARLTCH